MSHPLLPLEQLPGISDKITTAAESIAKVHRHIANRKRWDKTGGAASLRSAHASALLETQNLQPITEDDPIMVGALRVAGLLHPAKTENLAQITATFQRAPLQVCAHLHALAAYSTEDTAHLGKPIIVGDAMERFHALAQLITSPYKISSTLVSAIVHAEILTLHPFATMNGIIARAASRLVLIGKGFDPHNLSVPEAYWLKRKADYIKALSSYEHGGEAGVKIWLNMHLKGLYEGSLIAWTIAENNK